jgi:hypothetical protein
MLRGVVDLLELFFLLGVLLLEELLFKLLDVLPDLLEQALDL